MTGTVHHIHAHRHPAAPRPEARCRPLLPPPAAFGDADPVRRWHDSRLPAGRRGVGTGRSHNGPDRVDPGRHLCRRDGCGRHARAPDRPSARTAAATACAPAIGASDIDRDAPRRLGRHPGPARCNTWPRSTNRGRVMRYGPGSARSPNCNILRVIAAAIDVGTNTRRSLVARVDADRLTPLATDGIVTALGTGPDATGHVSEAGLELVERTRRRDGGARPRGWFGAACNRLHGRGPGGRKCAEPADAYRHGDGRHRRPCSPTSMRLP